MRSDLLAPNAMPAGRPIWPVTAAGLEEWLDRQPSAISVWTRNHGFAAEAGKVLTVPSTDGGIGGALFGLGGGQEPLVYGALAGGLPSGDWFIEATLEPAAATHAVMAFLLGAYSFDRYRNKKAPRPRLIPPANADRVEAERIAAAIFLVRDLVNMPANDLGPAELEVAARSVADEGGAAIDVTIGPALLESGFPLIHMVGAASARPPRLIDMTWGRPDAPKVTLVGKGVCFDSGGLDIKPHGAMALMKKDMGGAAHVLGLAQLVMARGLDIRLRVLIPAVENSISGLAFRPGDVFRSRKGLTVEIANTDAEGRLVLADALALADEEAPALLVDFATLTGAARTALGPDIVPFYTHDDALAESLAACSRAEVDPLWRMPLWPGYVSMLESRIADTNHISDGPFAGSITAALFLDKFVERAQCHVHFDIYAWNPKPRPGRPQGGEGQALRALYAHFKKAFG